MKGEGWRANQRFYRSEFWKGERLRVLNARGWRCERCGRQPKAPHVHHRYGLPARGTGRYAAQPLATYEILCPDCHAKEHDRPELARIGRRRVGRSGRGHGPTRAGGSMGSATSRQPDPTIAGTKRVEYDPITVNDPTGEAYRQCEMGRKEMMIRELVMNAVERCQRLDPQDQEIRIYGALNHPFPAEKLAIWNRGGMDLKTMIGFSDINAALHKSWENFGRGGKIASVMSNQLGLRYRSCHGGRVREVTLAVHPEERQIVRLIPEEGSCEWPLYVRDVTAEYATPPGGHDFLNLQQDWTEVALMGNEPHQETTRQPYLDEELAQSLWLFAALGYRFFRLPRDVRLRINSRITRHRGSGGNDGRPYWLRFFTMAETARYAAAYEPVSFEQGTIHYIRPRNRAAALGEAGGERLFGPEYANQGAQVGAFGGLMWRDELYYLHLGTGKSRALPGARNYGPLALKWGLSRTYKEVAILVELADGEAQNDINRVTLLSPGGRELHPEDFAAAVESHMPQWVRDLERELTPREDDQLRSLKDSVEHLIRELMASYQGLSPGGDETSGQEAPPPPPTDRPPGPPRPPQPPRPKPDLSPDEGSGERNAARRRRLMKAPDVEWVPQSWFDEHDVAEMAGLLRPPSATGASRLYFNEDHVCFSRLIDGIAGTLPEGEEGLRFDVARHAAKGVVYLAVCDYIAAGLALSALEMPADQVNRTLEPVVITSAFNAAFKSRHFAPQCREAGRTFRSRVLAVGSPAEGEAAAWSPAPLGLDDER